jgi:hypothetical protein
LRGVIAATAVLTAPAAAAMRPLPVIEHVLGHPIVGHGQVQAWLVHQTAITALLGSVLWLVGFGFWLGLACDVMLRARRGRAAFLARLNLAWVSVCGAGLAYLQAGQVIHPLVAAGTVLVAWRVLASTSWAHMRPMNALNWRHAGRVHFARSAVPRHEGATATELVGDQATESGDKEVYAR